VAHGYRVVARAARHLRVQLDFVSIARKVASCDGRYGCHDQETIGLNGSRNYLEDHKVTSAEKIVAQQIDEAAKDLIALAPSSAIATGKPCASVGRRS
jgi:hypothetical protein